MAKYNLLNPRYCKITETANASTGVITETLGTGAVFAKAIKASTSIKTSEAKMYADGGQAESVKEFISGSISMDVDDIDDTVEADVLGATEDSDTSEVVSSDSDSAPYVRFGYVVPRIKNHVTKYTAICYMKVCFSIPNEEYETKGESVALKGTTISGEILRNYEGKWRKKKTCDSLSAAMTYLNGLVSIT